MFKARELWPRSPYRKSVIVCVYIGNRAQKPFFTKSYRNYGSKAVPLTGRPYSLRGSGERPPDGLPQRYEAAS